MLLIAFNKPCGVMSQFSPHPTRPTLAAHISLPGVYPAGRLDADSEGLLLLTDDGGLQARIADPRHKLVKRYWAQVEGTADETAMQQLRGGVDLGDFVTRKCSARLLAEPPVLWDRVPPIRHRAAIPTSWLEILLQEGKNRQVRRMTAAVGLPTLRLVRAGIGGIDLFTLGLQPGEWRQVPVEALGLHHGPAPVSLPRSGTASLLPRHRTKR